MIEIPAGGFPPLVEQIRADGDLLQALRFRKRCKDTNQEGMIIGSFGQMYPVGANGKYKDQVHPSELHVTEIVELVQQLD